MIRFEDVSKEFHTKAGNVQGLNHVNLHISKGDIFGIIGMSGAGKSTFIRCINYLEHPTSGDVWIDGCRMSGAVGTTAARDAKRNRNDFSALQSSDAEERTGKYLFFIKNSRS